MRVSLRMVKSRCLLWPLMTITLIDPVRELTMIAAFEWNTTATAMIARSPLRAVSLQQAQILRVHPPLNKTRHGPLQGPAQCLHPCCWLPRLAARTSSSCPCLMLNWTLTRPPVWPLTTRISLDAREVHPFAFFDKQRVPNILTTE